MEKTKIIQCMECGARAAHRWKDIVGLDGTQKIIFKPSVHVKNIAQKVPVLRGKDEEALHAACEWFSE